MAASATHLLLLCFLISGLNCMDIGISLCNSPHGLPGCINQICETKVCETNPECCDKSWDLNCAQIACHDPKGICKSIGTSCDDPLPCDIPHSSGGCKQSECANKICEIKQDCCDIMWDATCVQLACDMNHGLCSLIPNACDTINQPATHRKTVSFESETHEARHLLGGNCANDPCPGHQQRNPSTCVCECPSADTCPGNQIYSSVLCECSCPTAPTCTAPQLFNTISCGCECPTVLTCGFAQQFDTETCECMTPITDCSTDPCPGYQARNPFTCDCECPSSQQCQGNQQFNVFCECGCVSTPICKAPKQFNPILCECECIDIMQETCSSTQIFNTNTCACDEAEPTAPATLCSNDPCPGGIQQRNPTTCECECAGQITTQCPGNQDFNILCECQCAATPICNAKQRFNATSCECECLQSASKSSKCAAHQTWNIDKCQCEDISSSIAITTSTVCPYATNPCPGFQVRNPITCDCECETIVQCLGNQALNVFCECGCVSTPICKAPQQFNIISCGCECSGVAIPTCNAAAGRILNADTCLCETVPAIQVTTTTIAATEDPTATPSSAPSHTAYSTTNTPTVSVTKPKQQSTIGAVSPSTASPVITTSSATTTAAVISTHYPIITTIATVLQTENPTVAPTIKPSPTPTDSPSVHISYTITKKMRSEIDGEMEEIESLLEGEEITLYEWAEIVIKQLIHYHDPIISESVRIVIQNVVQTTDNIVIEYDLEMKRIEIFGIVLYHIDSTTDVAINDDFRFLVLSNQLVTAPVDSDTKCAAIGDKCDGTESCCDTTTDNSAVLCIARSASNAYSGVCCIDYNNYGCLRDSDCCYSNSYCVQKSGLCRRKPYKRNQGYDASDSEDSAESHAADAFLINNKYDDFEHENVPSNVAADGVVLLISMKVLLCIVVLLVIGNVICWSCCIQKKWKETKQVQKETKYSDSKCTKKSLDINYII